MPLLFQEEVGPFPQEVEIPENDVCELGEFTIPTALRVTIDTERRLMFDFVRDVFAAKRIMRSSHTEELVPVEPDEVSDLIAYLEHIPAGVPLEVQASLWNKVLLRLASNNFAFARLGVPIDLFEVVGDGELARIIDVPFENLDELPEDTERRMRFALLPGRNVIAYLRRHNVPPFLWMFIALQVKIFAYFNGDCDLVERHVPSLSFTLGDNEAYCREVVTAILDEAGFKTDLI